MGASLIRSKYTVCEAARDADSSTTSADGGNFQRNGIWRMWDPTNPSVLAASPMQSRAVNNIRSTYSCDKPV